MKFGLSGLIAVSIVAACSQSADEPADVDTPVVEAPQPSAPAPTFDAAGYSLGWASRPLVDGDLVLIGDNGVTITSLEAQPRIGPADPVAFNSAHTYTVTVDFQNLEIVGEPVGNILAWPLDADGEQIGSSPTSVSFPRARRSMDRQQITATFGAVADEEAGVVAIEADGEIAALRFDANPVANSTGSSAIIFDLSVEEAPIVISTE